MLTIRAERLDLVAASIELLDAELKSTSRLASLLGAAVPDGWPPGEYDRPAIEFFRARLVESPDAEGWYSWYAIQPAAVGLPTAVVGAGGYFGPPESDGAVEIGYSIMPGFRGHGYAGEIVRTLVSRAFATPGITRVIAHTQEDNVGSMRVLERCGFALVGAGQEPGTVQYACASPVH